MADAPRLRIKEFREIAPGEVQGHDHNFRSHPSAQRRAFKGLLGQIGIVEPLLAYYSQRQGGLTLIDGHMRLEEHPGPWPCVILDLNDQEADVLLGFLDPITGMAEVLAEQLQELLAGVRSQVNDPALLALLEQQRAEAELAATMEALDLAFHGDAPGTVGGKEAMSNGVSSDRAKLRPVIWVEDIPTVEGAIRAVGNPNRGEAVVAICQFYLEHHGQE